MDHDTAAAHSGQAAAPPSMAAGQRHADASDASMRGIARSRRLAFGFGHSHLATLRHGYRDWQSKENGTRQFAFRLLHGPEYKFADAPSEMDRYQHIALALRDEVAGIEADSAAPVHLFTCFSGNEYHRFSMVTHERPFDFVVPNLDGHTLLPDAEIIPYRAMYRRAKMGLDRPVALLAAMLDILGRDCTVVCSPPPIRDDEFIRAQAGNPFASLVAEFGVGPAALRYKCWYLQSTIWKEACEAHGWAFLAPPPTVYDELGFLKREGWAVDPTHANRWYGTAVLSRLDGHFLAEEQQNT